ncbi:uncharacterized protein Dana_GF16115 [Drosophila ananassae]|uniref:NFX1-type zinc finger-containing protein 1 n=1 Tax=Drosophila ananassae TaxID=7217 RepID=B3M0K2_DROAN|nr:NFX1-type zinc finger-containing protein 1 [Drosophila ananassae]XP_032312167.1 NFX1-type zinc finger-containing protein 1 [Drosophila ananassae]EDV44249.1 uncharacterized protein Dana_GF16115 [Drosophila ananassae]
MSGSEDDDWFNQDEEDLVHSLEQKVRHQEQEKNEEQIKVGDFRAMNLLASSAIENANQKKDASCRFSMAEFTKGLAMLPIDMFLYFFSEDKDLFVNQLVPNDNLQRVAVYLDVIKSLCQLEMVGFQEDLLEAFVKQTVLHEKIKRLILTLLSKGSGSHWDDETELMLKNMMWLLERAHKFGFDSQQGDDIVELYKKLNDHLKVELFQESHEFSSASMGDVKQDIYPTLEALMSEERSTDEEEIDATSNDIPQYIKNQRELLRKDFFGPLRELVQRLREGRDLRDLEQQGLLWPRTTLTLNPEFNEAQRHSLVYLNLHKTEVNERCYQKALENIKSGSLLCLTRSLELENLILATVGYTVEENLKKGRLSVEIVSQYNIGNIYDQPLIMFQTPAFFEPYLRVHNYLSTCSTEQFPMRRYLVDGELDVRPPAYMKKELKLTYNGKTLSRETPPQQMPLNETQKRAFMEALHREFCIMQGPPGTGKTHLSVELVRCLIENSKAADLGPIVVLTYTNDSLDKFLVKMSEHTQKILRFGSQSRDPRLQKFNEGSVHVENASHGLKRIWWLVSCEYKEKFQLLQSAYANFDGSEESYQETLIAQQKVRQVAERLETLRAVFKYFLAKSQDIVAMTTTCAARLNFFLRLLKSKCVVFEEAAEIQESHVLACLTPYTEHVILVGDHKQLQPFNGSSQVQQISLFERLILSGMPFSFLNLQYRMRPCIAELLIPTIYEELASSDSVKTYDDIRLMEKNVFFLNHNRPEQQLSDKSFINPYEADSLVELTHFLLQKAKYEKSDIVILSPYNAQVECIREKIARKCRASVLVSTVDSFQGLEANIVLLSLVRSNSAGQIGFLRQPNRVCVALSRARWALYIAGNLETLQKGNRKLWGSIAERLEGQQSIGQIGFPTNN